MKATPMKFETGLELLKKGHSLTATGHNLDTLKMKDNGAFSWCGQKDQSETILEESDLKSLFKGRKWIVDLF